MTTLPSGNARRAPAVSVIVPVLNDGLWLARTLGSSVGGGDQTECIVVDGGSGDDSVDVAARAGARVLHASRRQRAAQMNLGAQAAHGSVLLFLHADTRLPPDWMRTLGTHLREKPDLVGGAFRRRFEHPSRWLRLTCRMADWRGRLWGCFLGDQAMFVRTSVFRALGGFRELDQCEDLDFSIRLAQAGRTCLLGPAVLTSARRFESRGPMRQTLADLLTATRFLLEQPAVRSRPEAGGRARIHGMTRPGDPSAIV